MKLLLDKDDKLTNPWYIRDVYRQSSFTRDDLITHFPAYLHSTINGRLIQYYLLND
jgi:hypothetical protein